MTQVLHRLRSREIYIHLEFVILEEKKVLLSFLGILAEENRIFLAYY